MLQLAQNIKICLLFSPLNRLYSRERSGLGLDEAPQPFPARLISAFKCGGVSH